MPQPSTGVESAGEPEPPEPSRTPRLIKRYANRKLYDTVQRRFTTLAQIKAQLRAGIDIVVLDHHTGQDRTVESLSQALGLRRPTDDVIDDAPDLAVLSQLIRAPARLADALTHDERDAAAIRELRGQVQALSAALDQLLRAADEVSPPRGGSLAPR